MSKRPHKKARTDFYYIKLPIVVAAKNCNTKAGKPS